MFRKLSSRNYKKCVICARRRMPQSGVFLSRLPLDPARCRMWVKYIGQPDLVDVPIEKLHELRYVCEKHFRPEDFNASKNRLTKHAIPSQQLNADPLPDDLLQNFPLHVSQDSENQNDISITTTSRNLPVFTGVLQDVTNNDPAAVPSTSTDKTNYNITNLNPVTCSSFEKRDYNKDIAEPEETSDLIKVQAYSRKRRHQSIGLTTKEEKLLKELKKAKGTIKKLSRTSLDLDKLDNATLKNLVLDAIKNHKKKPTGKRWTVKTKLWGLAIFKRSPKAYRYLQWALPLPGVKTLQRLLKKVPLEPGINKKLIKTLSELIVKLPQEDKYCALLFDEIALKKRLIYNEGTDKIEGFEDFGDSRKNNIADHALVFMVQGLHKKYKQPISYYFVKGTISSEALVAIIKSIIKCLNSVGFHVMTTICDQGPTNVGALNLLKKFGGQTPEENYFKFENFKIFIMYDIPHLFKSIRNNFYSAGEIQYNGKVGKWRHLIEAEKRNNNFLNFRKINNNVVHPSYKVKMRVKYAAHALSHTMSAVLKMLSWKHETESKEILETAEIIEELDKLFDFCNGPSSPKDIKKGQRENVRASSKHLAMWRYFLNRLDNIKFIKSESKLQLQHVRCIKGFKISIKSMIDIWQHLSKNNFKYLNLRQLNQDSLENLFGIIRQHSPTNCNPTCSLFTAALKSSILCGLTAPHSSGSNCEQDYNQLIFDYKNPLSLEDPLSPVQSPKNCPDEIEDQNIPELSLPDFEHDEIETDLCSFEDQPIVYVSGFFASKLLKINNCDVCKKNLTSTNYNDDLYKYISLREWWKDKKSLKYPSNELCQTINLAKTVFENNIKPQIYKNNLTQVCIIEFFVQLDLSWFKCERHDANQLLKLISKLFIRQFCKLENEKLSQYENKTADIVKKTQQQGLGK